MIFSRLPLEEQAQVYSYFSLIEKASEAQNLIGRVDFNDFVDHHVFDSYELTRLIQLNEGRFLDIGSGAGVVGILSAMFSPNSTWTLVDSEFRKCEFMSSAVESLSLQKRVTVRHERIEDVFIEQGTVLTSKAVGSIDYHEKILANCSTWNSLWLFKGKSFYKEKTNSQALRQKKWNIFAERRYVPRETERTIVGLTRSS